MQAEQGASEGMCGNEQAWILTLGEVHPCP
jgi:hypothetical protein